MPLSLLFRTRAGGFPSSVFLALIRMIGITVLIGLAPSLATAETYTTSATTFSGYVSPGYVIDSDRAIDYAYDSQPFTHPNYKRWYLPVQATGTVGADPGGPTRTLRMAFSLVDTSTGELVDLQNVATEQTTTILYSTAESISGNGSAQFTANLVIDPNVQLDPNRFYRVRAQLQRRDIVFFDGLFLLVWTNVGNPHDAVTARNFVHFKGPWGTDAARNVIARGNSHSFVRRYALKNVPARARFATNINYTLYRYDEPHTASATADSIAVRLTAQLFDAADPGTPIALTQSLYTENVAVSRTLNSSGVRVPSAVSRNFEINFEPAVQLDPVNGNYFVRVTVAHIETPPGAIVTSNSIDTFASRFLHLNGSLRFGSIQTTLTDLVSVNAPGVISNGMNLTAIQGAHGVLDGGGHTYGPGNIDVSVDSSGAAFCRAPSAIALVPPSMPDRGTVQGVSFDRQGITLSASGASGPVAVILPAGFGLAQTDTSKRLDPRLYVDPIPLGQDLNPLVDPTVAFPGTRYAVEESKPIAVAVNKVVWEVGLGRFIAQPIAASTAVYIRYAEMQALDNVTLPADEKIKRSNELYYRSTVGVDSDVIVRTGHNGGAEMSAKFKLDPSLIFGAGKPQKVQTHFPWNATFSISGGQIAIENDRIDPQDSYLDLADPEVSVPWFSGCSLPSCEPISEDDLDYATLQILDDGTGHKRLRISRDGGLFAAGVFADKLDLKWGYIPALGDYAHRVLTPFTEARVAIAGHFTHGADTMGLGLGQIYGPGAVLLSGVDENGVLTERPLLEFAGTPYQQGFADYPGLNLRLGPPDADPSGFDGLSLLAGKEYGPYALKNRSKYYIRASGVSGIHDKVFGSPDAVDLYGYDVTLTNFGLAFLSNINVDSRTNGDIYLPYPSDIDIAFDELTFHCNGSLDKAKVGEDSGEQTLSYWLAPIDLHTMEFVTDNACDPKEGFLALGVTGYSSHIKEPLHGTLGVFNHGNLIPKEFGLSGIDSRLKMPTKTIIRGPKRQTTQGGDEEYHLTPAVDAYFNNPGQPGDNWKVTQAQHPVGTGFINIAGRLKVAFFEAMPAHLQTSSNRPPEGNDPPGTWGTAVLHVANGKWKIGGADSAYFGSGYHDTWNRGLPYPNGAGGTGESLETYRTSPAFYPFVQQTWLGGSIVLKYKVQWNSSTRSFVSLDAAESLDAGDGYSPADTRDFVVVQVDHRLTYLSAERAELAFGIEYDGLPTINLANFVVNQLDEATGVFKAVTDAGLDLLFDSLDSAIEDLARALNDNLRGFYGQILDEPLDTFIDNTYAYLQTEWTTPGSTWASNGIVPSLNTQFQNHLQNNVFSQLNPAIGDALGILGELTRILTVVEDSLVTIRDDFLATDPNTQQLLAIKSLTRELIKVLSTEVDGTLASILSAAGVDQKLSDLLDPLLEDVKPTVAQLHDVVAQLADVVGQIRGTLDGVVNTDFSDHLEGIFTGAAPEFQDLRIEAELYVRQQLEQFGPNKNFLARDPEEIKTLIRNAVYDRLLDTAFVEQSQVAIKQRLYDVEHAIRQGLDSAFAQVNTLVKEALSSFLTNLDDSMNGVLGEFSDRMGSASLQGYAIFNGDALRKVRIDGKFEMQIPTEISIKAFLEINQYTSADQPPGCIVLEPGEALTEVEIGALDVGANFLGEIRVNITAKFSMMSTGDAWTLRPNGMGGSFALASGEVSFEAFTLTDFACGVMFGATENYVTAALGMQIGSWGAKGGVFFGRTCTLDPIELWDPFAASALGEPNPSFTGAYVYGEAHIPVSEAILGIPASCFFQITADAGFGFFYFIEGPTYGARAALGVGGEVLCLVSIKGRIDMIGLRAGSTTRLKGTGKVSGEIGPCAFCIKFSKSATIETEIGSDGSMSGAGGV